MNYADYKRFDMLDGQGVRHSLFVSGCNFHCDGCFNAKAWNKNYGILYTKEIEDTIINDLKNNKMVQGLSLLGGEPFLFTNELTKLIKRIHKECPDKDVWSWSGYTFEDLLKDENKLNMLKLIDVLVDGQFEINKRDVTLQFRGSSNQRIIDVQQSLSQHKPILWHED